MYLYVDNKPFLEFLEGNMGQLRRVKKANQLLWITAGVLAGAALYATYRWQQTSKEVADEHRWRRQQP